MATSRTLEKKRIFTEARPSRPLVARRVLCSANFNSVRCRLAQSALPNTLLHQIENIYNSMKRFFFSFFKKKFAIETRPFIARWEKQRGGERGGRE